MEDVDGKGQNEESSPTIGHSPESLFLELEHLIGEAHSFLANDVLAGNSHVLEKHFGCVRRPHAHLVDLPGDVHS